MGGSESFLQDFVHGPSSFAKTMCYSRRLQQEWRKCFDTADDDYNVYDSWSYAEQRMASTIDPSTKVIHKLTKVLKFCEHISNDPNPNHKAHAIWASGLCDKWCRKDGFLNFLKFGIDVDYAKTTSLFSKLPKDRARRDTSLNAGECVMVLDVLNSLLNEGRVFEIDGDTRSNWSYTGEVLRSLSSELQLFFGSRTGFAGQPENHVDFREAIDKAMEYARQLFQTAKELFHCHFGSYEWRSKFGAFDNSNQSMPPEIRRRCFCDIAQREGVDVDAAVETFSAFLPAAAKQYEKTESNKQVWLDLAESCRSRKNGPFLPEKTIIFRMHIFVPGHHG